MEANSWLVNKHLLYYLKNYFFGQCHHRQIEKQYYVFLFFWVVLNEIQTQSSTDLAGNVPEASKIAKKF